MSDEPFRYKKIQLISPAFPTKGMALVSSPKLVDSGFYRTVVLILKHSSKGSFGLVLNKPILEKENITPVGVNPFPLFQGGPVCQSSLFFLHDVPLEGAKQVIPGVFFGGKMSPFMLFDSKVRKKVFLGAATWSANQLNREMEQKFWIPTVATDQVIFYDNEAEDELLWKMTLRSLGGMYSVLVSFPKDPTLN